MVLLAPPPLLLVAVGVRLQRRLWGAAWGRQRGGIVNSAVAQLGNIININTIYVYYMILYDIYDTYNTVYTVRY